MVATLGKGHYSLLTILIGLLLISFSWRLAAAEQDWQKWPTVGKAQFTWLWFDVYQSTLHTPDGHYHGLSSDLVLDIQYQRRISAKQLLDATEQQWIAMGYPNESIRQWLLALSQLFPSVTAQDRLYFVAQQERGQLYFSEQGSMPIRLGDINDIELSRAFLSIWLGPQTQYPDLRKALIGETP